ncbi:MAG: polyprenyl synthetase family protein [Gammaproteobacteria bacterium]
MLPFMQDYQTRINESLKQYFTSNTILEKAMQYSLLDAGKRIRPMLVYATGRALKIDLKILDIPAAAIECIHIYSLIHDDLPAMDNDDLRHGKPTCHKAFGENIAILAGDALQSFAFQLLSENLFSLIKTEQQIAMIQYLTKAIGFKGMAAGQMMDITPEAQSATLENLQKMHALKTGALITASVTLAALCCEKLSSDQLASLQQFAHYIGLAFQIKDDLLDVESSTSILGKTQGIDQRNNKITYVSLLGIDKSKALLEEYHEFGLKYLEKMPENTLELKEISKFIIERNY